MRPWSSAVAENRGVGATGFLQGISEDRETVKGSLVIDRLVELDDRWCKPTLGDLGGMKGIADDMTKQIGKCSTHLVSQGEIISACPIVGGSLISSRGHAYDSPR